MYPNDGSGADDYMKQEFQYVTQLRQRFLELEEEQASREEGPVPPDEGPLTAVASGDTDPPHYAPTTNHPEAHISRLQGKSVPEIVAILQTISDPELAALESVLSRQFDVALTASALADSAVVFDLFVIRPGPGQLAALMDLRDTLRVVRDEIVARERWAGARIS